ncbi:hypothetical protein UJ101_01316 [Flavobacteriaceae bacterium UJ101]|nr:hypothetical protein UJ101_01316 [Flavobacteriaceae bacterium UJ101]
MNLTRAFIIFIGISLALMLMHFVVMYSVSDNDVPVLYNMYGFTYLVSVPIFGIYLFIETKHSDYVGYAYIFFNGLKAVLSIVWVLYLIKLLELDIKNTFLNFMVVSFVFTIAELIPLFKLVGKEKE